MPHCRGARGRQGPDRRRRGAVPLGGWCSRALGRILPDMKKRVFAALLWFYSGWYAGATIAVLLGISPAFGPILGAAAAGLIVGDPRRLIWATRAPVTVGRSAELA